MDPENIFTIIFIIVVLSIPFWLGLSLRKAIRKRKEFERLFSGVKLRSGRVVGYTERRNDTENIGDYYAVIAYLSDQTETIWAETGGCGKDDHIINAKLDVICHPHDARLVTVVLTQEILRRGLSFEKNLELVLNVLFTFIVLATVLYYYGFDPKISIPLLSSYAAGFICDGLTRNKNTQEGKLWNRDCKDRDRRLSAAQHQGVIPCYLKE